LESSRAGVILLAELVVAVMSALWFGGETLTPMGWAGGALIAIAALVEAVDSGRSASTAKVSGTTGA
jgi:drug/metabolite transporter (DMT)-like permease